MILQILQFVGAFLTAWMGFVNISRLLFREAIPPMNTLLFGIGIALIFVRVIFS